MVYSLSFNVPLPHTHKHTLPCAGSHKLPFWKSWLWTWLLFITIEAAEVTYLLMVIYHIPATTELSSCPVLACICPLRGNKTSQTYTSHSDSTNRIQNEDKQIIRWV